MGAGVQQAVPVHGSQGGLHVRKVLCAPLCIPGFVSPALPRQLQERPRCAAAALLAQLLQLVHLHSTALVLASCCT